LHRFPAWTRTVRVRYDDDELAVVQQAAAEEGLRPAGRSQTPLHRTYLR
jgi:hypothetical protein